MSDENVCVPYEVPDEAFRPHPLWLAWTALRVVVSRLRGRL